MDVARLGLTDTPLNLDNHLRLKVCANAIWVALRNSGAWKKMPGEARDQPKNPPGIVAKNPAILAGKGKPVGRRPTPRR